MAHGAALKAVARKRNQGDLRDHTGRGLVHGLARHWLHSSEQAF